MYLNVFYFNVYLLLLMCIGASIANIVRCFVGPFGPLTRHLVPNAAVDVRSRVLANDRAAIRLCGWSIGCVRSADVGLSGGPPWSLVVEVDGLGGGRRGKDNVEKPSDLAKKRDINTNSYAVFNLSPFAPARKKTPHKLAVGEAASLRSPDW